MTTAQTKILVADEVSDTGLQPLRDAGFLVEKRVRLNPVELREALAGCAGLVVRSETKVNARVDGQHDRFARGWAAPVSASTTSTCRRRLSAASS